jgi:hypothetical protein
VYPTTGATISVPVNVVAGQVSEQQVLVPACPTQQLYLPVVTRQSER